MKLPNWLRKALTSPYAFCLIIILGFSIVYAASLTFVFVEGDDATSILYHALGRNPTIWPPYAAYQGMMDTLLSFLPANEPILRIFAISLSALAGMIFTILALFLIFEWLEIEGWPQRAIIAIFTLLAFPELFFLGLIYDPALIGMVFVLGAHLLARRFLMDNLRQWSGRARTMLLCSALLFGFGVSLRWYIVTYGLVVVVDLVFSKKVFHSLYPHFSAIRFGSGVIWGIAGLLAALFCIVLSGQGSYLLIVFAFTVSLVSTPSSLSLFSIAGLQTLITPVVVLLAGIGLIILLRRRLDLFLIVLAGGLSILPVVKSGTPKFLLPCIPALMLCTVQGLHAVLQVRSIHRWFNVWIRLGVALLLLAPWMVGIKLYTTESLWGPGFEMRKLGVEVNNSPAMIFKASAGGKFFPIAGISVALNDGMALSTIEGPRPLGAYGAVLLGGRWRTFVLARDGELQSIVQWAISHRKPLLLDNLNPLLFARIIANDYRFVSPPPYAVVHPINQYIFENTNGERLAVYYLNDRAALIQADRVSELMPIFGAGPIPLVTKYSSTLREYFEIAPQIIKAQGPCTALLDLGAYLEALK